jgi:hypothetical protein
MKNGQNLELGDTHVTLRNIQKVQASKLGDALRHPFFIGKNQVIFQDTIFLLLRILCFFLELLYFHFQFCFFAVINGWITSCLFWRETYSVFYCQEHSSFHSFHSTSVLFFLVLRLAFVFHLDFCSELVISLKQCVFRPLVYGGFHL